jgi:hypothetical protein
MIAVYTSLLVALFIKASAMFRVTAFGRKKFISGESPNTCKRRGERRRGRGGCAKDCKYRQCSRFMYYNTDNSMYAFYHVLYPVMQYISSISLRRDSNLVPLSL